MPGAGCAMIASTAHQTHPSVALVWEAHDYFRQSVQRSTKQAAACIVTCSLCGRHLVEELV